MPKVFNGTKIRNACWPVKSSNTKLIEILSYDSCSVFVVVLLNKWDGMIVSWRIICKNTNPCHDKTNLHWYSERDIISFLQILSPPSILHDRRRFQFVSNWANWICALRCGSRNFGLMTEFYEDKPLSKSIRLIVLSTAWSPCTVNKRFWTWTVLLSIIVIIFYLVTSEMDSRIRLSCVNDSLQYMINKSL